MVGSNKIKRGYIIGTIVFRIKAPDAQRIQIDLGKKYEIAKDTDGYWQVTTDSISEEIIKK